MSLLPLPRRALNRLGLMLRPGPGSRAPHYVRDYRRLVGRLLADHPEDTAMSQAVGGDYEALGDAMVRILQDQGLTPGMAVLDFGCGSGRLAHALGESLEITYLGLDVVPELLAYAKARSPAGFRFALNTGLTLPGPDAAFDMACAFSVFTHLMHEETFAYLEALHRVLKPDGRLVFSFLEFADAQHWAVFRDTVDAHREGRRGHLNVFIERPVIRLWAERAGFEVLRFDPETPGAGASPLGQSLAVLRRT